jgi:hypothetical protein
MKIVNDHITRNSENWRGKNVLSVCQFLAKKQDPVLDHVP